MAIKREQLPLPVSIVVTLVAYGVLSFVIFRERPGAVQSDFVNRLLAFLPHAIAFVNALALVLLAYGWWFIRNGFIKLHRIVMSSALGLIFLFLVMYVTRIYLGGVKEFSGPESVYFYVYLPILIIHLVLSIICIQPVLYVASIGLTHRIEHIPRTKHKIIGRIAVPMWILSLALGLVVYILLYRVY
jgi:putative membrane protein